MFFQNLAWHLIHCYLLIYVNQINKYPNIHAHPHIHTRIHPFYAKMFKRCWNVKTCKSFHSKTSMIILALHLHEKLAFTLKLSVNVG